MNRLADDSHEISSLIFSEKKFEMSSAITVISALGVKSLLFFIFMLCNFFANVCFSYNRIYMYIIIILCFNTFAELFKLFIIIIII